MSTGGKGVTPQPVTEQPKKMQEGEIDPAIPFESVEDLKLNIPFVLPEDIDEGRTEEEARQVKEVLEKAHLKFLGLQKSLNNGIRKYYEQQGKTYTLTQQLKAFGPATEIWLDRVRRWRGEEKWAMTAEAAELTELQTTNPLVKLLVQKSAPAPEPTTQPARAARKGGKRKQVVLESESEGEEQAAPAEEAEEEQQLYVVELDTYVPVDLIELALGDPAGNEQPLDSPVEEQGMDDYLTMGIVPAGIGEQVAPAEEREMEQQEGETPLVVYRRRDRREAQRASVFEKLVSPTAHGSDEAARTVEVEEAAEVEE